MEDQTTEWKRSWKDEYMKTIAAFNNTVGGKFFIGIENDGVVSGVTDTNLLLKRLSDSIRNKLELTPSVEEVSIEGKKCVVITVEKGKRKVKLDGIFYKRVGSTTQSVTGHEEMHWAMFNMGLSWTDFPARVGIDELSQEAINFFVKKGLESKRMSPAETEGSNESLFRRHNMMNEYGLCSSAALLFMEVPGSRYYSAPVKIGAFDKNERLLRLDKVDCAVIKQPDRAMEVLLMGYILGTDVVEGLMMKRRYPYPERALREAVTNAICHRDYSSVIETTIRVYPDHVRIANPCFIHPGWTTEDLLTWNGSRPTNPAIAEAFFKMGYIEHYGTGLTMIREECKAMNIPLPEYNIRYNEFLEVIFRLPEKKDKGSSENILADPTGLTVIELKVYDIVCKGNFETATEMSEILDVSEKTVRRALTKLTELGHIERIGADKKGAWVPISKTR